MARQLDTREYLDMACGLLAQGQCNVPVAVKGVSMRPFLRDGDMVHLVPLEDEPKPGEILLFQRKNGQYVLHRVYRRLPDGGVWMLGDSQLEPEPVEFSQLRGKAASARIGGRISAPGSLRWWFYAHPWRILAPLRRPIGALHSWLKGKS